MKTQYSDGRLSFDVTAFLDQLPDDQKVKLVETLSCEDAILKHVADQLLDGWTESGQYGATLCTASADPQAGNVMDYQRRRIARGAQDVAAKEVKRLEEAVAFHSANYSRACEEIHELRDQLRRR